MSGVEVAAIVTAGGAAIAAAIAVARTIGKPPAPVPPAVVPPAEGAPQNDTGDNRSDYLTSLFGAWSGLLTTAGAVAAAVGGYQLAKDIGKGDATGADQIHAIAAVAAFALGIALLITIPVSLRARNRVTISDAVASQRRWNFFHIKHFVVAPSSLFGYRDIVEFEKETTELVKAIRKEWEAGNTPLPSLVGQLKIHRSQREQIEGTVATIRIRSASRRAVFKAGAGMILAVAGFADATYITNHAERLAAVADAAKAESNKVAEAATAQANKVADAATAQKNKIDEKILDAALALPSIGDVLPAVPSDATVSFPDAKTAAAAFGVNAATLVESCWKARDSKVYDVGNALDPSVPANRTIYVVFPRTDLCRTVAAWIEPAWLAPRADPPATSAPVASTADTPSAPTTTAG